VINTVVRGFVTFIIYTSPFKTQKSLIFICFT
jgi:hypothetical protein